MKSLNRQFLNACRNGDLDAVQKLFRQGANLNQRDKKTSITPLIAATQYGHDSIIDFLIQHGANLHLTDGGERNLVHYAISGRHIRTLKRLLQEYHLDPNHQDAYGVTPFLLAAEKGDVIALEFLTQNGANIHAIEYRGMNALHIAILYRQDLAAYYLLSRHHFDPNTPSESGYTAFILAARMGNIPMLDLLFQYGADPYHTTGEGQSAAHEAIEHGHLHALRHLLFRYGLDPDLSDAFGITPFILAAKGGHLPMIQFLHQYGANPYYTNECGRSALHYAAIRGRLSIVRYLITQFQLDPNQQDHDGNTPLHFALQNLHFDTAKTLIHLGANPHIPNHQGQTPAAIARRQIRLPKPQPSTITL